MSSYIVSALGILLGFVLCNGVKRYWKSLNWYEVVYESYLDNGPSSSSVVQVPPQYKLRRVKKKRPFWKVILKIK